MSQSFCRGCAGTGISGTASPREAQAALLTIYMRKQPSPPKDGLRDALSTMIELPPPNQRVVTAHARVDAWETAGGGVHTGRLAMSGPLAHVIEHVNKRLADGWEIARGSLAPDPALLCPWCGGFGVRGQVLTVHSMSEAIELGGNA